MKYYNKINAYLLERFPILWNTQFIWIVAIGILLHLLFWVFGYVETDIELLKNISADKYFYNSGYVLFYIITQISILIYFGFKYLNHHPFRNFYPLGKNYFWKLSGILSFLVLIHGTIPLAFESGVKTKAMQIIDRDKEEKYAQVINTTFPFLYSDITDYYLVNRVYPAPFPLKEIKNFYVGFDSIEEREITHGIDHKEPFITLNGNEYQFATTYDTTFDCELHTYIKEIKDVSKTVGLTEFSVLNFNRVLLNYSRNSNYSYDSFAPYVHDLYLSKNTSVIKANLQSLKSICEEFYIENDLDADAISKLVFEQDLNKKQLIKTELRSSDRKTNSSSVVYTETEAAVAPEDNATGSNDRMLMTLRNNKVEMYRGNFYADLHAFQNIYQNLNSYEDAGYTFLFKNIAFFIIVLFGIVFFFIIIKHIQVANLLMGVLYSFLISTLFVVLNLLLDNKSGEDYLISGIFYLLLFLFGSIFLGYKREQLTKRNNMRLFLPVSIAMQMILPLIAYYIQDITKVIDPNPCNSYPIRIVTFELGVWHLILNQCIAFTFMFWYLRALHASKE
jgi:hypothetical protein